MELFVDSEDWFMDQNVYGMTHFADGGTLATKPYFLGLLTSEDGKLRKRECSDIWDALFWNFIDKKRDFLLKNYRNDER
jgi:deoxyribodipyrimidine photolyase-related protein